MTSTEPAVDEQPGLFPDPPHVTPSADSILAEYLTSAQRHTVASREATGGDRWPFLNHIILAVAETASAFWLTRLLALNPATAEAAAAEFTEMAEDGQELAEWLWEQLADRGVDVASIRPADIWKVTDAAAEVSTLRAELDKARKEIKFHMDVRGSVESVLTAALGATAEHGSGSGLAGDVDLLREQRDAARAEAAELRAAAPFTVSADEVAELRGYQQRKLEISRMPDAIIAAVRSRDGDHCRYCGVRVDWRDRRSSASGTYDHVDKAKSLATAGDVVVACRSCNNWRTAGHPLLLLAPPLKPDYGTVTMELLDRIESVRQSDPAGLAAVACSLEVLDAQLDELVDGYARVTVIYPPGTLPESLTLDYPLRDAEDRAALAAAVRGLDPAASYLAHLGQPAVEYLLAEPESEFALCPTCGVHMATGSDGSPVHPPNTFCADAETIRPAALPA